MVKLRILAAAALVIGALLVGSAPAAHADCVDLTLRYEALSQGEETGWDGCLVPTPLNNQNGHSGPTTIGASWLVYVYIDVWYPLP